MPERRARVSPGTMARRPRTSPPSGGTAAADAPAVLVQEAGAVESGVVLLEGASARVEAGEVLAVTGANGAGKTTLLRIIAGLRAPTAGRVLVHGRRPDDRDRAVRRDLAALVGPVQTARDLTVREHLRFLGATWGMSADAAVAQADALLAELDVSALRDRFPHELSSGQSQLISLALTLGRPARVLLLDEPEQRLDAERLALVTAALRRRAEDGTAIVLASHSARLVEDLAGDALHLRAPGTVGEVA